MNIYLIKNRFAIINNIEPKYYIGSDTKDRLKIEEYAGSSKHLKVDLNKLGIQNFSKTILWQGSKEQLFVMGYSSLTALERDIQIRFNIQLPCFYNKAFAGKKFFINNHAVYYYLADSKKKTYLLPVDHPDVVNGLAVGRNKGKKASPETLLKLLQRPKRPCSPEKKLKLSKPRSEETKTKMRKQKKDTTKMKQPKSSQHKLNLSLSHPGKKKVLREDSQGNITIFNSIKDAAENCGNIKCRSSISDCCREIQKKAYGFKWRYLK